MTEKKWTAAAHCEWFLNLGHVNSVIHSKQSTRHGDGERASLTERREREEKRLCEDLHVDRVCMRREGEMKATQPLLQLLLLLLLLHSSITTITKHTTDPVSLSESVLTLALMAVCYWKRERERKEREHEEKRRGWQNHFSSLWCASLFLSVLSCELFRYTADAPVDCTSCALNAKCGRKKTISVYNWKESQSGQSRMAFEAMQLYVCMWVCVWGFTF